MAQKVLVIGIENPVDLGLKCVLHDVEGFSWVIWDEAALEILGIVHLCDLDGLELFGIVVPSGPGMLLDC